MVDVAFCAILHQPWRIRRYSFLEIGEHKGYFDDPLNGRLFERISNKCYLPALKMLKDLAEDHKEFKVNLSFTGTFLDQAAKYKPQVIQRIKDLNNTGKLEIIGETYYHSLAFFVSEEEFHAQIKQHQQKIKALFGAKPKIFRNTESLYSDSIARSVEKLGFKGIVTEGSEKFLGWRSSGHPYKADGTNMHLFLRNYKMSDDIAFRFSARNWKEYPLTAEKYAYWLAAAQDRFVMLYIDFETFGEHQWPETGIFEFLRHLPTYVGKHKHVQWTNLSQLLKLDTVHTLNVPWFVSWADQDRDTSAWLGNKMQRTAFETAKALEKKVLETKDEKIIDVWRRLMTSDHFYYMSTKFAGDEEVHSYFRGEVYENPYEAFANYMNIIQDF
ncbi:MAG: polysaccharide deacetylase family protein, partial [Candidatus Altiarchaeota archaeon]|nr:polysaccharide deacetylase family protein [Candidatus Altiarchaeota archaeon]